MLCTTEICRLGNVSCFVFWCFFFFSSMQNSHLPELKVLRLSVLHLAAWSSSKKLTKCCWFPAVLSSQHRICLLGLNPVPWAKGREWHKLRQKETWDEVEPSVLDRWHLCISMPFSLRFWFLCGVGCGHLDVTSPRASSVFTDASCMAHRSFLVSFHPLLQVRDVNS